MHWASKDVRDRRNTAARYDQSDRHASSAQYAGGHVSARLALERIAVWCATRHGPDRHEPSPRLPSNLLGDGAQASDGSWHPNLCHLIHLRLERLLIVKA